MKKICSKCDNSKLLSEFSKDKSHNDGHCSVCKDCVAEYRLLNGEKISIQRKLKYENHKDAYLLCSSNYYRKNRDKVNKTKSEHIRRFPKIKWAESTLESHKKKGIIIEITVKELRLFIEDKTHCCLCDKELDFSYGNKSGKIQLNSPSLDRINNEGVINITNIQIVCNECNKTKGVKPMKEFIEYCDMISKKFVGSEKYGC